MKKIFTAAIFSVLLLSIPGAFNQAQAGGSIPADICFVVDTSGSMGADIAQVQMRIVDFNTAMVNAGIDAQYCLVEFGGNSGNGGTNGIATLFQDVVPFATFNAGGNPFSMLSASTGGNEPGSLATTVALGASFRQGSVINIILITDEDDDSSLAEFNAADAALGANNALFNFIGVPGVDNTDDRYGVLATNHGGSAFGILAFRADPATFFANFIDTKVAEIMAMGDPREVSGEFSPIDTTALLLAGVQSSVFSIVSVLSLLGAIGIGAFYYNKRKN